MDLKDVQAAFGRLSKHMDAARERRHGQARVALRLLDSAVSARLIRRSHERASPNVFRVLGLETKEDTVSRMLAWLLDPRGSHGLGASFLLDFLLVVAPAGLPRDHAVLARLLHDSAIWSYRVDREVARGSSRADLVVDGREGRLVIETKLGAAEGDGQTARYLKAFRREVGTVFAYLCPDSASAPQSDRFVVIRYSTLLGLVSAISDRYIVHPDTNALLRQFVSSIQDWGRNEEG